MNGLLANGVDGRHRCPASTSSRSLAARSRTTGCTRFFAVPPIVLALAKHPIVDDYDLSSLRRIFSGAAPLGAELASEAAARIGCEVVQGYGMTELCPVTHCHRRGRLPSPASSGSPSPTPSAASSTPRPATTGRRRARRAVGARPAGDEGLPRTTPRPRRRPSTTTAGCTPATWPIVDDDGHFCIVDRLKELIKYKGFQVPPAELEALLLTHPKIADCRRHRRPRRRGRRAAEGVRRHGAGPELTDDEVKDFVNEHVAQLQADPARRVHRRDPQVGQPARSCARSCAPPDPNVSRGPGPRETFGRRIGCQVSTGRSRPDSRSWIASADLEAAARDGTADRPVARLEVVHRGGDVQRCHVVDVGVGMLSGDRADRRDDRRQMAAAGSVHRCGDRAAAGVPEHDDQIDTEFGDGVVQAGERGGGGGVAGDSDDEEIARRLVEDDRRRHPGVRAGSTAARGS